MIKHGQVIPFICDRERLSPNVGSRNKAPIRLIILHATADRGNEKGAEDWMTNPAADASCHIHIRRDGSTTRLVRDEDRAWHAGKSSWPGVLDVNDESLGWEIANRNDGQEEYTDAQYKTVVQLLCHYLPQGLEREDVLSHALIAPARKTDPLGWDWDRMWREYTDAQFDSIRIRPTVHMPEVPKLDKPPIPNPLPEPGKMERITLPEREPVKVPAPPAPPRRSLLSRIVNPFTGVNPMRTVVSRIAAAIVAAFVTFLAGKLGLAVSPETQATLVEGVTFIGMGLFGVVYGILHKLFDRKINPADAAKTPTVYTP